ncbi:abortive infection system antitoxin AbiGi family protein [Vibrio cyclitrophicus]
MQPKSHTLFHFTKDVQFLKDILKNGFWPRFCLEDVRWYTGKENQCAYPITCFCDIPLSRVDEHVDFYGNYGIGVTKEWAKLNKLSPVIYINEGSAQQLALTKLFGENLKGQQFYTGADDDINAILTHIKPIEGKMFINGQFVEKEFHQENEWRFAINGKYKELTVKPFLIEANFKNTELLEAENAKSKRDYSLKVSPSDIRYLFVKSDSDIPSFMNFIQSELDNYSNSEIKVLMSRVISLETISRDM